MHHLNYRWLRASCATLSRITLHLTTHSDTPSSFLAALQNVFLEADSFCESPWLSNFSYLGKYSGDPKDRTDRHSATFSDTKKKQNYAQTYTSQSTKKATSPPIPYQYPQIISTFYYAFSTSTLPDKTYMWGLLTPNTPVKTIIWIMWTWFSVSFALGGSLLDCRMRRRGRGSRHARWGRKRAILKWRRHGGGLGYEWGWNGRWWLVLFGIGDVYGTKVHCCFSFWWLFSKRGTT